MLLLITNGIFSAILFLVVGFPPLYINRCFSPEEDAHSPCINEICSDITISNLVKEKLYLLVSIPLCVTANCIFLYFTYYRSIRFIQFRVEKNILSLCEYKCEVQKIRNELDGHSSGINRSSMLNLKSLRGEVMSPIQLHNLSATQPKDSELNAPNTVRGANITSILSWRSRAEFIRYSRPNNVKKDTYVIPVIFREIRALYIEVENIFFTSAMIAEKNFLIVKYKLVDTAEPQPNVNLKPTKTSKESTSEDYSNSKRIPALLLGVSVRKQLLWQQQKQHTRELHSYAGRPMGTNAVVHIKPTSNLNYFHSKPLMLTDVKSNARPSLALHHNSDNQLDTGNNGFEVSDPLSTTPHYPK
ncbi:unnamed protein product [Phytomonas sp. Hart1]|nr:unnamed protein product [Phytomonas sp. Hart1]|eukprot:CCW70356.1 unnamed protein product [Phytomonas sp. isolate Hart1]